MSSKNDKVTEQVLKSIGISLMQQITIVEIFKILADPKAAQMLLMEDKTSLLNGWSRREYYGRLHKLIEANLIHKNGHNKYNLTTFGTVTVKTLHIAQRVIANSDRLRLVDIMKEYSLSYLNNDVLKDEELREIVMVE
jgi:repressor of nif and glnA expression